MIHHDGTQIAMVIMASSSPASSTLFKPPPSLVRPSSIEASLIGDYALIDRETGRVLWEGGARSTLAATVAPKLKQLGFTHLRASLLSAVLALGLLGYLSQHLQRKIHWKSSLTTTTTTASPSLWSLPAWVPAQAEAWGLVLLGWTLFRAPVLDVWLLVVVFVLYLWEAYNCSTHRYLSNAIRGLDGVESYIEQLRSEKPDVQWKVCCYHYEMPWWLGPIVAMGDVLQRRRRNVASRGEDGIVDDDYDGQNRFSSSWFSRRVVTNQSSAAYQYSHCVDKTIAGVWRPATVADWEPPPFTKLLLSVLLVLPNVKARDDYMKQQGQFVTDHGQGDHFAEFSTGIHVSGFKPRLLAVRPSSAKGFFQKRIMFWAFTLVGLTVPFRMWFSDNCDEVRVTVVKELLPVGTPTPLAPTDDIKRNHYKSWFMSTAPSTPHDDSKTFRSMMQGLRLYARQEAATEAAGHNSNDGSASPGDAAVEKVPNLRK